ncbi:DUF421 domain-containing protein [Euryhalocaulis caribicus]|uniref:DUF421 domain-containing protein n=1 Tax=Euryhalocaulis caribicus TaxID=1161401 RepID=UPI0003A8548E|nr:YetF domain-containing protein [Euryhalocaulis caribicus]
MLQVFIDGVNPLWNIFVSSVGLYFSLIIFIRISGKRSTSQMNNFDWLVTVALGSIVASGIVIENVSLSESLFAVVLLLMLQFFVTRTVFGSRLVSRVVKAEPRVLMKDGEFLREAMKAERVTEDEILSAVRSHGLLSLQEIQYVILETNASFSIISRDAAEAQETRHSSVQSLAS